MMAFGNQRSVQRIKIVQVSFAVDFNIDHKGMGPQHRPKTTVLSIRNGRIIRVWLLNHSKVIYMTLILNRILVSKT